MKKRGENPTNADLSVVKKDAEPTTATVETPTPQKTSKKAAKSKDTAVVETPKIHKTVLAFPDAIKSLLLPSDESKAELVGKQELYNALIAEKAQAEANAASVLNDLRSPTVARLKAQISRMEDERRFVEAQAAADKSEFEYLFENQRAATTVAFEEGRQLGIKQAFATVAGADLAVCQNVHYTGAGVSFESPTEIVAVAQ